MWAQAISARECHVHAECEDVRMRDRAGALVAYCLAISRRFAIHRGSLTAGGLAYFVALSIAPAAIVVGGIVGLFVTPDDVRSVLTKLVAGAPNGAAALGPFIDSIVSVVERSSGGTVTIASLVSLVIAVYASSRVVYGLRMALNTSFGVPERFQGIAERLLSSAITLIGLVGAVAVIIVLTFVPKVLALFGVTDITVFTGVGVVDWTIVTLIVWISVWWLLHRVPNKSRPVPIWAPGPMVAALWIVGSSAGVGIYVGLSGTLGAAILIFGSALVVLLWLYLCFIGLLIGAEMEAERQERQELKEGQERVSA